jgi:hypothetical protein
MAALIAQVMEGHSGSRLELSRSVRNLGKRFRSPLVNGLSDADGFVGGVV